LQRFIEAFDRSDVLALEAELWRKGSRGKGRKRQGSAAAWAVSRDLDATQDLVSCLLISPPSVAKLLAAITVMFSSHRVSRPLVSPTALLFVLFSLAAATPATASL
jgi:hypothetical protein